MLDTEYPQVARDHLFSLLVSSVRYALGRSSYVTSLTCGMVTAYAKHLRTHEIEVIIRDIAAELDVAVRKDKHLGMRCDHNDWKFLLNWLCTEFKVRDPRVEAHDPVNDATAS